jgi:hypothetical protein
MARLWRYFREFWNAVGGAWWFAISVISIVLGFGDHYLPQFDVETPQWRFSIPFAITLIVLWTIFTLLRKVVVLSDRLTAKIGLHFDSEGGANIRETHFNNDQQDLVKYVSVTVTALSDEPVRNYRGYLWRAS